MSRVLREEVSSDWFELVGFIVLASDWLIDYFCSWFAFEMVWKLDQCGILLN